MSITPYPETPAAVAAAVLDQIEAHPEAFDMRSWVELNDGSHVLPPTMLPTCQTTLCAAGWAAHVTGWHIVVLPDDEVEEDVLYTDDDGTETITMSSLFAEKDGQRRMISDVASKALGLRNGQTFWYEDESTALERLREIAGR